MSVSRRILILIALLCVSSPALAAWPNQSAVNLPVCTASNNQLAPMIAADGSGGAIITWYDFRGGGNGDIYAQHVLPTGVVDPAWPVDGRSLCTATNMQALPVIVSDGAGGAIVAWQDARSGVNDIYAQHVLASGAVDPAWPTDGRALCTATGAQLGAAIVSDGAGGAIVTWNDQRSGTSTDIYAQHVLAGGTVDPAWPVNGRALCTATNDQVSPVIVSDGAGGAIVAWQDYRANNYDIYAQHVLASGSVDSQWPVDGRAICTAGNGQGPPQIAADGAGGAIVTWMDYRNATNYDIYAQHVLAGGAADPAWPANGRSLCSAQGDQASPVIVSDGAGGAIVAWQDNRSNPDIYALHVLANGLQDPAWPADGRAVCTTLYSQSNPAILTDGAGGAIITWQEYHNGFADIYAQHVLATGAIDTWWPSDGRAVSTASNDQTYPMIISDNAGGAIITWQDSRPGGASYADIYAQRVARFGYLGAPEAEIVSVKDVPNDQGGRVKLSWNASYLDLQQDQYFSSYDILRSVPASQVLAALRRGSVARSLASLELRTGDLIAQISGGQTYYWEYVANVAGLHYLSGYSYLAPTACDSVAGSNPRTAFMVVARSYDGNLYWPSRPDSGYSVDNLPPGTPSQFTGQYAMGTARLHWLPNPEADLAGYRLYRGVLPSFVPDPTNRIAAPPDTGYTDVAGGPFVYKLSAVDLHGNESPVATLTPGGSTGVGDDPAIAELILARPVPNPASRSASLAWALPRAGHVRLTIYDAAGRVVRVLADGPFPAGTRALAWDLRDDAGRAVGAGLYFARIEAEGAARVRRIAVTP